MLAALKNALGIVAEHHASLNVLELGCGTGLFGQLIRPLARSLGGIDLSAAMVERARERGIYDSLETAEITAWPAATRHLAPNGILGFTVEHGTAFPFRLTDSGRFTHHQEHLVQVAQEAGLRVVSQTKDVLRYEYGEPVVGVVTVMSK